MVRSTFLRQTGALYKKNMIVLSRHWFVNALRCIIFPLGYAFFFAHAVAFFSQGSTYGPGSSVELNQLPANLLGRKLLWSPPPRALTNPTILAYAETFMSQVTANLTSSAKAKVQMINNATQAPNYCPENLTGSSECFAVIVLNFLEPGNKVFDYTLRSDPGLMFVNTANHKGDQEARLMPLQWALDSTFLTMNGAPSPPRPMAWGYTQTTNAQYLERQRQQYLRIIISLISLLFFINFLGAPYHSAGGIAWERSELLTSHMEAQGLQRRAKVISWWLSIVTIYGPAWLSMAVIWGTSIWTNTNIGLLIVVHLLYGFAVTSWSFLVAAPFGKSPTLAAIVAVFLAIIMAIVSLLFDRAGLQLIFGLVFPPSLYISLAKVVSEFETRPAGASLLRRPPKGAPLIGLLAIALLDTIIYPLLAVWLESKLYGVKDPSRPSWIRRLFSASARRTVKAERSQELPVGVSVQVEGLKKTYKGRLLGFRSKKRDVAAIECLDLTVNKGELLVVLGRNGASKTTSLGIICGLLSSSGGHVRLAQGSRLGIAPQKNIEFPELTVRQHFKFWQAIKSTTDDTEGESIQDLIDRCDLTNQGDRLASALSGGMKRKMQLGIALVAKSNVVIVDEISSGLDALSRRKIWRTLLGARDKGCTIIMTTHFLDEADLLADRVAIMEAPGRLLACAGPAALKTGSQTHGAVQGYSIKLLFASTSMDPSETSEKILTELRAQVPTLQCTMLSEYEAVLQSGLVDESIVTRALYKLEGLAPDLADDVQIEVHSTSLEDVFLGVSSSIVPLDESTPSLTQEKSKTPSLLATGSTELPVLTSASGLHQGRALNIGEQTLVFLRRRLFLLFQSPWNSLIGLAIVSCCSLSLLYLKERRQSCAVNDLSSLIPAIPLTLPVSSFGSARLIAAPPNLMDPLRSSTFLSNVTGIAVDAWSSTVYRSQPNLTYGAISMMPAGSAQVSYAYEATPFRYKGLSVANIGSNLLHSLSFQSTGYNILVSYLPLPFLDFSSTGDAMKTLGFLGLGLAVFPAFFVLLPTSERRRNIKSSAFSNGGSPAAYWLGHLCCDALVYTVGAVILTALWASSVGFNQFNGLGYVFLCLFFYFTASTIMSYLFSLRFEQGLAAFAVVAAINVLSFLLYLAANLLILTYDKAASAGAHLDVIYWTMGLANPAVSVTRALLVSLNVFSLLCDGLGNRTSKPYGSIAQFGGPILYTIVWAVLGMSLLLWIDSGKPSLTAVFYRWRKSKVSRGEVRDSSDEKGDSETLLPLEAFGLNKTYKKNVAVADLSFTVASKARYALLGPNGAGKSTTLSMIQGQLKPDNGEILIEGTSILTSKNEARASIGICAQTNAIDDLTVTQHLEFYGRLRGLKPHALKSNIRTLLSTSGLDSYAHRQGAKLSGGNQRKLMLSIAMIGSPSLLLVDEFSSGVDAASRREGWKALEKLTKGKAVLFTTHSLEEVEALADKCGIVSQKMLVQGTVRELKALYNSYEVQVDPQHVQQVLEFVKRTHPTAIIAQDTTGRIEVSMADTSLSSLFDVISKAKTEMMVQDIAVNPSSMESVFIKVISAHNVKEEGDEVPLPIKQKKKRFGLF